MINRMDSKDGSRSIIAIYPDEDMCVTVEENNINLIEGSRDALKQLYYCLEDMFDGEDDE